MGHIEIALNEGPFRYMPCLSLNFVILLPALAWRSSDQQLVGSFVICDGFGLPIKLEGPFRALGDASEAENLAEFTANREV